MTAFSSHGQIPGGRIGARRCYSVQCSVLRGISRDGRHFRVCFYNIFLPSQDCSQSQSRKCLRLPLRLACGLFFAGLLGLCGADAGSPHTAPIGEKELVRRFEARYRNARSLQVSFLERYSEQGKTVRMDAGTAYFRRPGKMRWEYESPEAKVFVSDGRTVWFYVPADRTAMRGTVKEDADERTPLALLTGNPRLARLCAKVVLGQPAEAATAGNQVLHCQPRGTKQSPQGAGEILLEIVPETGELSRVRVEEAGGSAVEFSFSKWKKNVPMEDSLFHFAPPLGVAIVNVPATEGGAMSSLPR